jgi:alkanesulfonate monooxygenase SsuD/methylene tetrahydromethanopterin reductase-like flavin-dependent oxidoreductase (luciferase family)
MVTPLARRRPVKVARETATLDRPSGGRLTLGVGLGSDRFASEFSVTGEELDDRRRGRMLDESLEILTSAWSGAPVHHRGERYTVAGMRFLPPPVQRPGVPVWVAGYSGNSKPLRRAARHQGVFPLGIDHPDQLADVVAEVTALRTAAGEDAAQPYGRRRPPARERPRALCRGGRHLVAGRASVGSGLGRPGPRCDPRRHRDTAGVSSRVPG